MSPPSQPRCAAVVRVPAAALGFLSLVSFVSPLPTVQAGPFVFGEGPAHQVLDENSDPVYTDCEGDGRASLTWTPSPNRLLVAVEAVGCLPTWSLLVNCGRLLEDGTFRCTREGPAETLNVTLTPEGHFEFLWSTPDFTEWDVGDFVRVQ
jgi:hypothetical protein